MKAEIFDTNAKVTGEIELSDRIFSAKWNPDLVNQALKAQLANSRQIIAHTKGRGEVRGGGRKPWRQKGTGRARHGSNRSPIWKGGGVTHGPSKDRIFAVKINKKMKQTAIFSVLSKKLSDGELKVIESLAIAEPKTRLASQAIKVFSNNALVIYSPENKNISRATSNLPKTKGIDARSLNVYDLLCYKDVLLEKEAVELIEKHYHAV
jgi:large subunit ribosomal protein L4